MKKISLFIVIIILASCDTLPVQDDYCEVAFAYPANEDLPVDLEKERIGCACCKKDILRGIEVSEWKLFPLEKCRRVRGFHPKVWKETIDPFFQYQSQKIIKKK